MTHINKKIVFFVILLIGGILILSYLSALRFQRKIETMQSYQNQNIAVQWQRYFHPEYQFEFQYPSYLFNEKVQVVASEGIENDEKFNHKTFSIYVGGISDVISLFVYEFDNNHKIFLNDIKNFDCGSMGCIDIQDMNSHFEEYKHVSYKTELGDDIEGENIVVMRNNLLVARKIDDRNLFYLLTSKISNDESIQKIFQSFKFSSR